MQAELQNNRFRRQALAIGKARDNIKNVGKVCDGVQDKIQRLPVSGETWDRTMKRKHSSDTVFAGSTNREVEPKRVKYLKQANDAREQPSNVNQPHSLIGAINHKRAESSVSHLSQRVGQRPQKNSSTRRRNGVSPPVYNCDEMPMPFEGERGRNILNQSESKELSSMVDMVDQPHKGTFLSSQMDLEYKLPSLYRRLLSALIDDDQTEETVGDEDISFLHEIDYTETVSCNGNTTVTCDQMFMEDELIMELRSVEINLEPVAYLARCQTFEDPMFNDVLFATPALDNHTVSTVDDIRPLAQNPKQDFAPSGSFPSREQNVLENSNNQSNLDFARTGPILNGGRKGKVLSDDVGASANMGGKKGKVLPVGASANMGRKKGEMLLDDVGGNANMGGKKGKVLPVGVSANMGGRKGKVLPLGASANMGGKKGEMLLDDVGDSANMGGKKGKVLPVGVSANMGGKKGEMLLDDVGASDSLGGENGKVLLDDVGASATLGNSSLGGTKRKRSKRGPNKDTSMGNSVKKGGRSAASNTRSERKTKAKAKPKTDGLSTSAKGSIGKLAENTNSKHHLACGSDQLVSSGNSNVGSVSLDYSTNDTAIETALDLTNMPELDSIEVGADKDLDSWLDNYMDPSEDDDDVDGLDIPMDDLFTIL